MSTRQRDRAARRKAARVPGNYGLPARATMTDMQRVASGLFALLVREGLMEVMERDVAGEPTAWQATAAGREEGL